MDESVVDAHIDPIRLTAGKLSGFLQTSPEAAMKRLLSAGAERIFQIGPVFRGGEQGALHQPEFTMLEWYRVGDGLQEGVQILSDLIELVLSRTGTRVVSYRQLFRNEVGLDPVESTSNELRKAIASYVPGVEVASSWARDDLLDVLLSFHIQPKLKGLHVVTNYPLSQAALARRSEADPETAERFECFVDGVELANGYVELTDADELLRRVDKQNALRQALGKTVLPVPMRLISAMRQGLPESSGTALGVDRLVMLKLAADTIGEGLTFPWN